ncbi:toluene tolerance protein [Shewanella sp. NFH-SH190041]|uniref:MlaC/ttg2D family ABC transporter substrate-binding protein n=1 Tax=Shewanella sp. NFH-SH190041 TaxID=2950245 RepID=UPI0021C28708|nr:ABC transporter substrate-binding protein [Shewanella sp. NFH-SH190041]BDM63171.1 toluene tolerance protein [Shewanella sp. NFH-SH190041]
MWKGMLSGLLGLCLAAVACVSQAQTQIDTHNPYAMMKAVANQTFARFHADKTKIDADKNYLKVIVAQELMPYVDYKYAALKAMGRYVRSATPQQRQAFADAFEGYLVTTYAQAFTAYTNQTVEFDPGRGYADQKQLQVDVRIIEAGRPDIKVAFKVRRLKDGSWKAFDMIAEGVSLLRSKTSEFDVLIRQQGLDAVIKLLKEKAADSITEKSSAHEQAA